MRAAFLAAWLLVAPLAAPIAAATSCDYNSMTATVVPNTNYWVALWRSACTNQAGVVTHKNSVLVTTGNPNDAGSQRVASAGTTSSLQSHPDKSGYVQDNVTLELDNKRVWVDYRSDRDSAGFTTCSATVKVRDPPNTYSATTNRLDACPPHEPLLLP